MGVDSARVPELAGVREFKSKFVPDGPVDVPGAWDVPVRPRILCSNPMHRRSSFRDFNPRVSQPLPGTAHRAVRVQ